MRSSYLITLSLLSILASTGCRSPELTGAVTDVSGNPISGAMITIIGTTCQQTTDALGSFSLPCRSGDWRVAVTSTGYISKELEFLAAESKAIDAGNLVLIKIPKGEGLFLFDGNGYESLTTSSLKRQMNPTAKTKSFCINAEHSTPYTRSAGSLPLYDKKHGDWRLWRLNDKGCAYTQHLKSGAKLGGERVDCKKKSIDFENAIYICDLIAGDYFIANWRNGFFVESASSSKTNRLFSGYHLIIR